MKRGLLFIAMVAVSIVVSACRQRLVIFEVPDRYVGWVVVSYRDPTCVEKERETFSSVIRISEHGTGCSRHWNGAEGLTWTTTYYVASDGRRIRELEGSHWGEGGEIWASEIDPEDKVSSFFVGPEVDFNRTTGGPHALQERVLEERRQRRLSAPR